NPVCGPRRETPGRRLPGGYGTGWNSGRADCYAGGQASHRRAGGPAQRDIGPDGGTSGRSCGGLEPCAAFAAAPLQSNCEKEMYHFMSRFDKIAARLDDYGLDAMMVTSEPNR